MFLIASSSLNYRGWRGQRFYELGVEQIFQRTIKLGRKKLYVVGKSLLTYFYSSQFLQFFCFSHLSLWPSVLFLIVSSSLNYRGWRGQRFYELGVKQMFQRTIKLGRKKLYVVGKSLLTYFYSSQFLQFFCFSHLSLWPSL